jgi:transcriptional regulator with XRE-family HTH domain
MTQATLADVMEIPRTSLILVERGEQRVHAYELIQLASALGTTPEALIQDVAPPSPSQLPDIPPDATPAVRRWISAAQAPPAALAIAPRRRR